MNRFQKILFVFIIIIACTFPLEAQYEPGNIFSVARGGNLEYVEHFIAQGVDQDTLNQTLAAAVAGDQAEIVSFLISKGADVNQISSFDTSLLINAIMSGRSKSAEILVKSGADLSIHGYKRLEGNLSIYWDWTPLMCAAYKGYEPLVKLMVSNKADVKATGWSKDEKTLETAADVAAYSGQLKILQFLQKKGASLSAGTLFQVISAGHFEVAKYLLDKEKNINQTGPYGKTLLMEAAWWGHKDIVKYLLDRGADPNIVGPNGYTALGEAAGNAFERDEKQREVIELLVAAGADVNLSARFKMTPLMRAVEANHRKVAEFLEAHGAQ